MRITLAPLGQDTVTALLADAFGAPPAEALASLAHGAVGNPELLAELIAGLRDDHAVRVADGRAVPASDRLPQRIHRLARQRLDDLSDHAQHLLTTAAVLGREFRLVDAAEMPGKALELLRDAARQDSGTCLDARHVPPLLALAATLIDLRQCNEADSILRAADHPALPDIPARAVRPLLRGRVHLAAGQLADAATHGRAALAIAQAIDAHGYAAAAHSVLSLIELRRGDMAAATGHIARRPATTPHLAEVYARSETATAQARLVEAREGPAAALGYLRELCADLRDRPGLLLGDPAMASWLTRTALAAGNNELAADVAHAARALADAQPGFPVLAAAAAHSQGLARRDPGLLAQAASQHLDPWAGASAREDLGVLHATKATGLRRYTS
jgi:hypothetical protein